MPYFRNTDANILFLHIPKTGGTSIQSYLSQKFNIPMNYQSLYGWNHPDAGNDILFGDESQEYSLQHLTYRQISRLEHIFGINTADSKLTILTVIRTPYNRVISDIFFFVKEFGVTASSSPEDIEVAIRIYLSSDNNFDNHRMTQYDMIKGPDGLIPPNIKILRTETLVSDMQALGFHDFNLHENKNRADIDPDTYWSLLTGPAIELIYEYYQDDFKLLLSLGL